MNIVEVQDNLKSFSQGQLINEINQPSGMVPQFLVLTELGRRNRIKQDVEGRQAQNQPTVAQEVVSAAGVPQGGIMDMARSMAPKSSIEQNDAVNMMKEGGKPRNRMDMLLAYLRSLGADEEEEVKEATGGKSIAEIINFGGDFRPVEKKADGGVVKMQQGTVVYKGKRYFTDGTYVATTGPSGRFVSVDDPEIVEAVTKKSPSVTTDVGGIGNVSTNLDNLNPMPEINPVQTPDGIFTEDMYGLQFGQNTAAEGVPTSSDSADMSSVLNMTRGVPAMRDPAVIDPTTGLPYDALGSLRQQAEQTRQVDAQTAFDRSLPTPDELMVPFNNTPSFNPNTFRGRQSLDGVTSTIGPTSAELERAQKILELNPSATAPKDEVELLASSVSNLDMANSSAYIEPNQFDTRKRDADGNLVKSNNFLNKFSFPFLDKDSSTSTDKFSFPFFDVEQSTSTDQNEVKPEEKTETSNVPDNLLSNVTFSQTPEQFREQEKEIAKAQGMPQDNIVVPPKVDDDDDDDPNSAVSSLESEIANMLKENEEDREQDKWLALAKMGLALMSSSNPTFGGALGEAGMAGVEDLQASKKAYRDDKITLLDAQRKLELARATAAAKDKSGLTGTNVISRLNNIQTRKTGLLQKIAELENPSMPSLNPEKSAQSIETLKREVADLSVKEKYFQSLLGGIGSLSSSSADFDATAN